MEFTFYKLVCKDSKISDIYVGKTRNTKARWNTHRFCCNNKTCKEYNLKVYRFIRDNGGTDNWEMVQLETQVLNKDKASLREGYWYEELKATLNTCKPGRTHKEYNKAWKEANRDKCLEYNKEYNEANRDKLLEYKSKRIYCTPCKTYFTQSHKTRHFKTPKHQNNLKNRKKIIIRRKT